MKRKITYLLFTIIILIFLTSCENKTIANVTINDNKYYSFYLYEFEDANVSNYRLIEADNEIPTSSGFVFSKQNLEEGDDIKVWTHTIFNDAELGTTAKIVCKKSEFPITIKTNIDTYTITYYDFPNPYTSSADTTEPKCHTIEVSKDTTIIEYN